jgi:hypothetical protein
MPTLVYEAQVILVEQMILYVSDRSIPTERGPLLVAAFVVVYGIVSHPFELSI